MIKVFLLLFVHKKKFFLFFLAFLDNFSFFAAWELQFFCFFLFTKRRSCLLPTLNAPA